MYTEELASAASKGFDTLWNNMSGSDQKSLEAVHGIQRGLQCCGRNSPADWLALPPPQNVIPASCCADGATICTQPNAFTKGCGQLLFDTVNSSGMLIAWIAIVFGAFEVRLDLLSHDKKNRKQNSLFFLLLSLWALFSHVAWPTVFETRRDDSTLKKLRLNIIRCRVTCFYWMCEIRSKFASDQNFQIICSHRNLYAGSELWASQVVIKESSLARQILFV